MTTTRSPWMDVAGGPGLGLPSLAEDLTVDVAVVGGGITGVTCALELADKGLSVALLEKAEMLGGETARTTAHCTSLIDARYHHLEKVFGENAAMQVARASEDALDTIEAYALSTGNPGGFRRVPAHLYTESEAGLSTLAREARSASRAGLQASLVREVPIHGAKGGLRLGHQAYLHPRAYLRPLLARYLRLGGLAFENTRVVDVEDGSPCLVHTPFGSVRAGAVVLATNVPLNRFFLITKLASYRTYVVAFPLRGDFPEGLFFDDGDPYHYVRRHPHSTGELLLVGGEDHKVGHQEATDEAFDRIEAWTLERFSVGERRYEWSGQIVESADGLPMIGRNSNDKQVFVATAYAGNGITFGTHAAQMLSELVLGREHPDEKLFAPTRIRPRAQAVDYLVENVDYPYYLLKDRLRTKVPHALGEIARGEGRVLEVSGERLAVHRTVEGELLAVSPVCTHMGCIVHFNGAERTWDCPCHGGRYDVRGRVLNGPPLQDLEPRSLEAPAERDRHAARGETPMARNISAIDLLQQQHREVESLFQKYEQLGDGAVQSKRRLFIQVADALSAHASIEEMFFYPRIHQLAQEEDEAADELVREAVEEHLSVKRVLSDLLDLQAEDAQFDPKMELLMEQIRHHVREEERELFPKVIKLLEREELFQLGAKMRASFEELMETEPRTQLPGQTDAAAPLD